MSVWPVYIESWQHDCCGTEFVVGDRVSWHLALRPDVPGFEDFEVVPAAAGAREGVSGGGFEALELRWAGVHAWWEGPQGARRGLLVEERHDRPAAAVATVGVVQRVRAVRRRYAWSGRHSAEVPTTDPVTLAPVAGTSAPRPWRDLDGWLADLLVEP